MHYLTYLYKDRDNYGILTTDKKGVIPMNLLLKELDKEVPTSLLNFIRTYSNSLSSDLAELLRKKNLNSISIDHIKILSPIPYPRRNIFCLGKNYADHAMEIKSLPGGTAEIPKEPIYFTKIADPAIGHKDYIVIPKEYTNQLDYEVELAIIIARDGKNISIEEAQDYIFGYTISNDISARDIQKRHIQWFKGKSLDNSTSIGPWIVDKSLIKFPVELDITCKVNKEVRQSSNTRNLIFDIATIISDLSKGLTLRAGDIILTGTPAGVGLGMDPPQFLKSGDIVECSIENIGNLINYVK